jgi:uncharacterized protein YndB with AHSA1/START domain
MTVTSCPVATIRAPIAAVWGLLSQPSRYETWSDGELVAVDPPGPAFAGQVIRMRSRAAGRRWPIGFEIVDVVAAEHRIAFDVSLPLGIVNREVISCRSVSPTETWVTFN